MHSFFGHGRKNAVYRFVSLSTQEEEFHHGSLLMAIHLNLINGHFDSFRNPSVTYRRRAIEDGMIIQI
jgi:hypothetical protein